MLNAVTPAFEEQLRGLLDAAAFKADTAPYFTEPRGRWQGQGLVVAPADTAAVAAVVAACAEARVGIVPYSGGTGLVGGQVMADGPAPVVLSLERLNKIRAVYPSENVLVCEAGVILAHVQQAAEDVDRLFPLSLASEGSARIGGLLATNAGGVNVLRYGNARALCLGLEVVRPDGTIWHGLTRLRKDNTGYDLRNLMIGAEGTLGIITAAALRLVPRPVHMGAALLAVPSPQAALDLLALAGAQIGDGLSAFELMHRQGCDFLAEVGPDVRQTFAELPEWSVLIDLGLPASGDPDAALEQLFADAFDAGLALDGVIAQSAAQRQALWDIRENIPEANRRIGSIASHDIALPLSAVPEFIAKAEVALRALGDMRINCFGHLGDGNLHYNIFPAKGRTRRDYDTLRPAVQRTVHDLIVALEGSVSAEHGIGRAKVGDLQRYGDPAKLAMLRAIKDALDPQGIMNPGVILPAG
ncbi:FAD-binding oxidoreductase [Yoonia vestfoldensis]|uniref:FAD-binding oxidoreductase n=1 Tax=Yoonia vestfoldensis TaxID=245188 RepID=UPI000367B420|nr:FAD-binding oxidoreductase [Yoonia vestfoldensis]